MHCSSGFSFAWSVISKTRAGGTGWMDPAVRDERLRRVGFRGRPVRRGTPHRGRDVLGVQLGVGRHPSGRPLSATARTFDVLAPAFAGAQRRGEQHVAVDERVVSGGLVSRYDVWAVARWVGREP